MNAPVRTGRDFLRAPAGAALMTTGAGCRSESRAAKSRRATAETAANDRKFALRVAQWRHGVPSFDASLDNDVAKRWDEDHDIEVVVDHIDIAELPARAEAEVAGRGPHDIFGFCDGWAADPINYRADIRGRIQPGLAPDTWEEVLRAAPKLKTEGHPIGIGMAQEVDSNLVLMDLLHAFGASVQDEHSRLAINRPASVEAVKLGGRSTGRG